MIQGLLDEFQLRITLFVLGLYIIITCWFKPYPILDFLENYSDGK
jgi:hypothetical protein